MEKYDNYKVGVNLFFSSSGHHSDEFPDMDWSVGFDATDVNLDVMLEQFKLMLNQLQMVQLYLLKQMIILYMLIKVGSLVNMPH